MFQTNYLELVKESLVVVHDKASKSEIIAAIKDYLPDNITLLNAIM